MTNRPDPASQPSMQSNGAITDAARRAGRVWGWSIAGGLGLVVVINFGLIWLVSDVPMPLVREDYYTDALSYADRIADGEAAVRSGLRMEMADDGALGIKSASAQTMPMIERVTARFYRPNDPLQDFTAEAKYDAARGLWLPNPLPSASGRWDVTAFVSADGLDISLSTQWYKPNAVD